MSNFVYSILMMLSSLGYFGIMLGLAIEIIPSEIVLGYGGYMISKGMMNYPMAILSGVIGCTIAQLILYWAGYYGGRPFLEKYGKYILIRKKEIDLSEEWFKKYGAGVVFFARFIPVVRQAISIPAGISKMSVGKFTIYTIAATIPWTILFLVLGNILGKNWTNIKTYAEPYVIPTIIVSVVLIVIYFWIKKKRK